MKEHEERFEKGGMYESIVNQSNAWVIIDFRSDSKQVRGNRGPNMIHVCYSDDFSKATLLQNGKGALVSLKGE